MRTDQTPELKKAVRRLTLEFAALIVLVVLVLGTVAFALVYRSADEANTRALVEASRVDSPRDAPRGIWVAVWQSGKTETSAEQIPGLPDQAALERAATSREAVRSTVTSGGRIFDVLTTVSDRGGVQVARDQHESQEELLRLVWALVIASALAAAGGALAARLMARRAIQPMARALELQRRFVADASHELRTPLTILSTRAQLAKRHRAPGDAPSKPPTPDDLDQIIEDAHNLTAILEDLLIAADTRSTAAQTSIDISEVARAATIAVEPRARERSLRLDATAVSDGAMVLSSKPALRRLFASLLDNAIDHASSLVTVSVAFDRKTVTVRISDDGDGFVDSSHAFERFTTSRGNQSGRDGPRHYGIGLALVVEIAARSQGTVLVEDAPGGSGATIVVELPRATGPA